MFTQQRKLQGVRDCCAGFENFLIFFEFSTLQRKTPTAQPFCVTENLSGFAQITLKTQILYECAKATTSYPQKHRPSIVRRVLADCLHSGRHSRQD